jgi:hypothetical protein
VNPVPTGDITTQLLDFLSGALMLSYIVAGVCFLRFWKRTKDRCSSSSPPRSSCSARNGSLYRFRQIDENRTAIVYGIRLLAFLLILGAIIDKNRGGRDTTAT